MSPSAPIPAAASALIACAATDAVAVSRLTVTVSGGLLPNDSQTQDLSITPGPSADGTILWRTPPAGNYAITCTATNAAGATATAALPVSPVVVAQVIIDSLVVPTAPVLAGSSVQLSAAAHDLSGAPVTYAWSASAGTLVQAGATATWTAPASGGSAVIAVTAANAAGSTDIKTAPVTVVVALAQGSLSARIPAPRRLAASPDGRLYATDARGGLWMLNARGELMGQAAPGALVVAVAASATQVFASTRDGKVLRVDPSSGAALGQLDLKVAHGAVGMAFDARNNLLWVAERSAGRVRALRPSDGLPVFVVDQASGVPLTSPVDVAVDAAGGLVWVLLEASSGGAQLAHAFDGATGAWVRSAVASGAGGQVYRGGGISVDAGGRVYASDFFNGTVQVLERTGLDAGKLGAFGADAGQLKLPAGSAMLANGDLVVANGDNGRLERFGTGAALPSCPGDSDCDGMPDWWEVKYGLDPNNPADALTDLDGDGLSNLKEYLLGTDPTRKDTDGDGIPDGQDPDPLHGSSQVVLAASGPGSSGPGQVRISSAVQGGGSCAVAWTQAAGPQVTVQGAQGFTPSFVARQAATYALRGVATCGGVESAPALVEVKVLEVAPRADAGRVQVARLGEPVELEGTFSSDANGGPLSLSWDQVLGAAASTRTHRGSLVVSGSRPGTLAFQLTATDAAGLSSTAEAPVVVLGRDGQAPTAAAVTPAVAEAGKPVTLAASGSAGGRRHDRVDFRWRQVEGAPVALSGAATSQPTFTPAEPGRYAFAVSVEDDGVASLPARVEVFVSAAQKALPRAAAQLFGKARLGQALELSGGTSAASGGGTLAYRWKQVAGPAAGLTAADQAVATVVPFAPGAYAFELTVAEGKAESLPARVAFAVAPSSGMPVAVASARVGRRAVVLDGRASRNAARWRWTQVAGPWVALDGGGAVVTFEPRRGAQYAFELEVDDGQARSAPVRVVVSARGGDRDGDDDGDDDSDGERE